mmetsp:Transcript_17739/g.47396  ORF Transcript_17739/g.47396 Transcript_17739/m.47396 type:complete len:218 (-) Transcript_17739:7-660(-)
MVGLPTYIWSPDQTAHAIRPVWHACVVCTFCVRLDVFHVLETLSSTQPLVNLRRYGIASAWRTPDFPSTREQNVKHHENRDAGLGKNCYHAGVGKGPVVATGTVGDGATGARHEQRDQDPDDTNTAEWLRVVILPTGLQPGEVFDRYDAGALRVEAVVGSVRGSHRPCPPARHARNLEAVRGEAHARAQLGLGAHERGSAPAPAVGAAGLELWSKTA